MGETVVGRFQSYSFCRCSSKVFPWSWCAKHKKHEKSRKSALFKEAICWTEMSCLCNRTSCCSDVTSNQITFSSKGRKKRLLEQSGDGWLGKNHRILQETINSKSTKRVFRTNIHAVASCDQTKKVSLYLIPEKVCGVMEFSFNSQFVRFLTVHVSVVFCCFVFYSLKNFPKIIDTIFLHRIRSQQYVQS